MPCSAQPLQLIGFSSSIFEEICQVQSRSCRRGLSLQTCICADLVATWARGTAYALLHARLQNQKSCCCKLPAASCLPCEAVSLSRRLLRFP